MNQFVFSDGSAFEMPTDPDQNIALWEKALVLKLRDTYQTEEDFRKGFEIAVEGYWHRKVVPTKFGTGPWEKPYANLAELAKDVMYQYLRAYIMALAFEWMAKETDRKPVKVAVLEEGGGLREIDTRPTDVGG